MGRKGNMWICSKQSESVSDRVNNREISCAGEKRQISSFKRLAGNIKSKSYKGRNGEKLAAGGWRKDGLVEMRMLIIKTLAENATLEAQSSALNYCSHNEGTHSTYRFRMLFSLLV